MTRYTEPSKADAIGWGNPGYYEALYDDVLNRRVSPRSVIGTGYLNARVARACALDWCASQTYRQPYSPEVYA